ncbi:MAG: hypothetical protein JW789_01065 [Candidatus Aenigmarchaeota archaeon]|nr:hypothetical protein [Candidatus Aenigmarchaeota archaeon]
MKGQTSMVAILISIVLLVFIMFFLFSTALSETPGEDTKAEYRNLYVTNMLISLLNTDTECGTVGDIVKAFYFGGYDCSQDESNKKIGELVNRTLLATGNPDYVWLLETRPENFISSERQWGDSRVTDEPGFWDATTFLSSGGNRIEVKLYIQTK